MCTVSFVPTPNGFILTSNRDEKIYRPTIAPKVYINHDVKLLYPKDEVAGGTWIVAKENGTCIVLLNGAFINHHRKPSYSKSRGTVLIEIIQAQFSILYFQEMKLDNVEPFTLIILQNKTLTEVKWDGNKKYIFEKSIKTSHIWSSATLYNRGQRTKRKLWFEDFCRYNKPLSIEKLLSFHTNTQVKNTKYGLVINREDKTKTVSITQLQLNKDKLEMTYIDRINNKTIEKITF